MGHPQRAGVTADARRGVEADGTICYPAHVLSVGVDAARPRAPRCLGLVLLGGPGSGKGTQAEHWSKELQLQQIATGDLFRENLRQATELRRHAKAYMDRGSWCPTK